MESTLTTIGLPVAKHPKAVLITLACQLILLPGICFWLVLAFNLPPVLAVVTLPLITNLAIAYFMPGDTTLGLQLSKTVEVFVIVLGPVVIGMHVRKWKPAFADAMDTPVRIASVVLMFFVALAFGFDLRAAYKRANAPDNAALATSGCDDPDDMREDALAP